MERETVNPWEQGAIGAADGAPPRTFAEDDS